MRPFAPIFLAGVILALSGFPAWGWFLIAEWFVLKNAVVSVLPNE